MVEKRWKLRMRYLRTLGILLGVLAFVSSVVGSWAVAVPLAIALIVLMHPEVAVAITVIYWMLVSDRDVSRGEMPFATEVLKRWYE